MNDETKNGKTVSDAEKHAAEAANQNDDGSSNANETVIAEVLAEYEKMQAENEDLKDRYIRLAADMENLRRRTARDVKDARNYAIANFARDMLGVSDNLRRALEAVPPEARRSEDKGFKSLIEGVEMTERDMQATLERHGVHRIDPKGEKFDPNFHQAMYEVPNPDVPNNSVFEVVQVGFVIGDRVLRPAMVGVAKGGPKMEQPAAETAEQPTGGQDSQEAEPGPINEQAEKDA